MLASPRPIFEVKYIIEELWIQTCHSIQMNGPLKKKKKSAVYYTVRTGSSFADHNFLFNSRYLMIVLSILLGYLHLHRIATWSHILFNCVDKTAQ